MAIIADTEIGLGDNESQFYSYTIKIRIKGIG